MRRYELNYMVDQSSSMPVVRKDQLKFGDHIILKTIIQLILLLLTERVNT